MSARAAQTVISQAALFPKGSHLALADKLADPGLAETFEHCCAVGFRHCKRVAAGSRDLLEQFRGISLPIFGKLAHLFDRVFENLGHRSILPQVKAKCEMQHLSAGEHVKSGYSR